MGIHRGQERVLDHLELELQVVVRHPIWILESEFLASAKRVHAVNHRVILTIILIYNIQHPKRNDSGPVVS